MTFTGERRCPQWAADQDGGVVQAEELKIVDATITLPAAVDIQKVADLREEWLSLLQGQPATIVVNVDELARIDTTGLQLLCALRQSAEQRGIPTAWQGYSAAIVEAAELLGLTIHLHLKDMHAPTGDDDLDTDTIAAQPADQGEET